MDEKYWAEINTLKKSIAHNLELWCEKIREDTAIKIKKVARDIELYKQSIALKEIKTDLGELMYDGWIGSPEEDKDNVFGNN